MAAAPDPKTGELERDDLEPPLGLGAYRGSDSTGFEMRKPLSPAFFSPIRPKPYPAFSLRMPEPDSMSTLCTGVELKAVRMLGILPTGPVAGRASFARSRHEVIERLPLAVPRKSRPANILRQPMANRKKADTRANSPT